MRPRSIPVVVNAQGGTARAMGRRLEQRLRDAFADAGLAADLHLVAGSEIGRTVRRLRGRAVVAVGGGDGTIASAAAALAGSDTALAVLPLGTLNHFAKQLGVPAKLEDAITIALHGCCESVDLGRLRDRACEERVFVNNASLGLYTRLVRRREASRLPKWLATIPAAFATLREMDLQRLEIDTGAGYEHLVTPLMFVGNNRYALEEGAPGNRESLCDGVLSLYAVAAHHRLDLMRFGLRAIVGRADPHRDFCEVTALPGFEVLGEGAIDVAHDGEVERLQLPLRFEILPRALSVVVPSDYSDQPKRACSTPNARLIGRA